MVANDPSPVNKLRQAALQYARLGWAVFPCHTIGKNGLCTCHNSKCKSPGKHPRTPRGRNDATTDRKIITAWWDKWPDANVAIATGAESGLAVLDCDEDKGGLEALAELRKGAPATFATPLFARTGGGGAHLFFRHEPGLKNGTNVLADGIDIRAEGGYVIGPPSRHVSGRRYQWLSDFDPSKRPELPSFPRLAQRGSARDRAPDQGHAEAKTIREGGRNDALIREAGLHRSTGKSELEIVEALQRFNAAHCLPPLDDAEVRKVAASAAKYPPQPKMAAAGQRPLTDSGNAELIADLYGQDLRYNHRQQTWLVWRQHFWAPDCDGGLARLALLAARHRQRTAVDIEDLKKRTAAYAWGVASESRSRIEAAIALARGTRPLSDTGENWDSDPLLLGCQNGVIDLRTGQLRPGQREDRITMATPHDFLPDAPCPRWQEFLRQVLPDPQVRRFVGRAIGYSVTGLTREQCFFLLSGTGSNGKTTLLETLANVLGPICLNMPFSSFTTKLPGNSTSTNDIARLPGKRLVSASETGEASALDEARIKALSGEDTISARLLYKEFFDFKPVCKLWLSCNHRPAVKDDTHAFWRRVRCIEFPRRFSGRDVDPNLKAALAAESEGILAWCVRQAFGYLALPKLDPPEGVVLKTEEYHSESDELAEFFAEKCEFGDGLSETFNSLHDAYDEWADARRLRSSERVSSNVFARRLTANYVKKRAAGGGPTHYHGIGLRRQKTRKAGGRD